MVAEQTNVLYILCSTEQFWCSDNAQYLAWFLLLTFLEIIYYTQVKRDKFKWNAFLCILRGK